jgi:hypothetical protein
MPWCVTRFTRHGVAHSDSADTALPLFRVVASAVRAATEFGHPARRVLEPSGC